MSRMTRAKLKRKAGRWFEERFDLEILPTDAGDKQLSIRHKATGLSEYGLVKLGTSDEDQRGVVDRMMDDLERRVTEAGGALV